MNAIKKTYQFVYIKHHLWTFDCTFNFWLIIIALLYADIPPIAWHSVREGELGRKRAGLQFVFGLAVCQSEKAKQKIKTVE